MNPDQWQFRTIGETVGKSVTEEMITCLANDGKTIRKGSKNCWAHWVNTPVLVGADINKKQAPMNDDYFVWLTNEGITCPAGTGLEKCKQKTAN